MDNFIRDRVKHYFVEGDNNCAMTVLRVLGETFEMPISPEVLTAAGVMPGAGGVGGLCGLVTGALMFLGVWGGQHGYHRSQLKPTSQEFMQQVKQHLGSSLCCDLKPAEGDCAPLAEQFLSFTIPFLQHALEE